MDWKDWLILALVMVWGVVAVSRRSKSCSGDCSACSRTCGKREQPQDQSETEQKQE